MFDNDMLHIFICTHEISQIQIHNENNIYTRTPFSHQYKMFQIGRVGVHVCIFNIIMILVQEM